MAISPPPSIIELVSGNIQADTAWKKWINIFYKKIVEYFSNDTFKVKEMTISERDSLSPKNGMIIYNTTTNVFNFYENGAWVTK